uniref:Uncharacterized protein n=1 Tax=Magallana gigas TaxID=29159 RepID=K1Q8Z5_MAGGI
MLVGFAAALVVQAKRRANAYRRDLVFRPIGDYGVAVVHKSRLTFEQTTKEQLKSGTAPKKPTKAKPYQNPYLYHFHFDGQNLKYADIDRNRRRPPDDRNMPKTRLEDMHEGDESSF